MFTGIVAELGRVGALTPQEGGVRLVIEAGSTLEDLEAGGSVAVNGCCLTATSVNDHGFEADAVTETLARTCLGALSVGDPVNLERPVRVDGRLDGHLVQGHVDATGVIAERRGLPDGSFDLRVTAPDEVRRYVVHKGSICVDGVSLTVARVNDDGFSVALIPHTARVTTLGHKAIGASVNLEVDVVAKYVERLVGPWRATEGD